MRTINISKPALIVIGGPTASGKSAVAVKLCARIGGEVISADSMQIYRGMDIGTAKPDANEREGIVHHLLDIAKPDAHFSAAEYKAMASSCVEDICIRGFVPVVCGGTGLYIDALTRPMRFSIEGDEVLRRELDEYLAREGAEALWARLNSIDPETARRLHINDVRRVSRAIEIFEITKKPMSESVREDIKLEPPYETDFYALRWPREALIHRIDERVDKMMEAGFIDEVERLLRAGQIGSGMSTARHALGYAEIEKMLRGELTLAEAVSKIKLSTRQYAKRQMTWLRRDDRIKWIDAEGKAADEIADEIIRRRNEDGTGKD